MPVPGGWMLCILMEMVPGVPLTRFSDYDFAKRERIRQAFLESMKEVYSLGVTLLDSRPENVIYDEKKNKCYFVDFEHVYVETAQLSPRPATVWEDDGPRG